jgi:hypothetical protein
MLMMMMTVLVPWGPVHEQRVYAAVFDPCPLPTEH